MTVDELYASDVCTPLLCKACEMLIDLKLSGDILYIIGKYPVTTIKYCGGIIFETARMLLVYSGKKCGYDMYKVLCRKYEQERREADVTQEQYVCDCELCDQGIPNSKLVEIASDNGLCLSNVDSAMLREYYEKHNMVAPLKYIDYIIEEDHKMDMISKALNFLLITDGSPILKYNLG